MRGKPRLVQRNDSPYWFIYVPPEGGKRASRLSTGETDYRSAERIFAQWLLERRKPELTPAEEVRVIDMLIRYAEHKAEDETVKHHMKHLQPFFEKARVSHICNPLCREYAASRPVKPGTVRRELDTLQAALGYARREGYLSEVPYIEKPPPSPRRERWLTPLELGQLLEAAKPNKTLYAFIMLGINTSQRPRAIYDLKWFQVDWDLNVIHFNPEGRLQNNKRRPSVAMNTGLRACLKELKKNATSEFVLGGVKSLKKSFSIACGKAKLKDVTPYTLRHTALTWAVRAGHGLAHAGQIAGHSDPRTTSRYAKHDPSFTKGVTDSLATGVELAQIEAKKAKNKQNREKKKDRNQ